MKHVELIVRDCWRRVVGSVLHGLLSPSCVTGNVSFYWHRVLLAWRVLTDIGCGCWHHVLSVSPVVAGIVCEMYCSSHRS